ncbi:hypothetical protein SAMN02745121_07001 [Nannocystis exedens]|uniref:Uncharacterized protein n=1 Tax=Nannocystis exedens TaxID=54 RepID=A0A1I2G0K0_9BACT|nr:hypothetical protein [Nannocystis exedens]SFF11224.1 hypothetical protein SAMN02745121_07001 [Nannocystis exedens]
MTISNGVPITPTLSPTMQSVVSVVALIANSIVEADKCRRKRLAGEDKHPTTLEEVMEKSGLKIPSIQEALVQLMGGTEEARKAASLIADAPDPANLLRQFAAQFGAGISANTGSIVTPPPTASPSPAPTAGPSPAPTPGTTITPPTPSSGLAKFRPEFTREARVAAKVAPTTSPAPSAGEVSQGTETRARAAEPPPPSLVSVVEHQLEALRRRMKAHEAELDLRLKRAEAELAKLRAGPRDLRAVKAEPDRRFADAAPERGSANETPVVTPPTAASAVGTVSHTDGTDASAAGAAPDAVPGAVAELDATLPLPTAASEQEVARAVELIGEFADVVADHHQRSLARVVALERELSAVQTLVPLERQAAGAAAHG